jgi:hypothetical protein
VTVDLYILRKVGLALRQFPSITTDVTALLDEWAARFFDGARACVHVCLKRETSNTHVCVWRV